MSNTDNTAQESSAQAENAAAEPEQSVSQSTATGAAAAESKPAEKKTAVKTAAPKKTEKKKYSRFNKKNQLSIVLLSLAVSFTIFFFSPMDIFLGNQREFVVNFKYVAIPMLIVSLACTAALVIIQELLLVIKEWLYQGFARLIFGFLLAIYTQSLFLNSKMTSITGDDAHYNDDTAFVVKNIVILTAIFILPLFLYILAKLLPGNKVLNIGKGNVLPYVSGLIFFMQLAGTGSSMLSADFSKYDRSYTQYLSYEPTMSLSKDGNVVVFLTDRLDSYWFDDVVERYPDVSEKLDGFTFYQNNVSHNTNTFPSVPQMLTHYYYKGTDWPSYTSEAWDGETVPKVLTENGYDVNLLVDNLTTYSTINQLSGQCSNIKSCEDNSVSFNYLGVGGIVPTMSQISFSKLAPYALKGLITSGLGSSLSKDFVTYDTDMPDRMPVAVDVDSDLGYYDYIREHRLNADNENKTFTFVHLNCSHGSDEDTAALYDPKADVDIVSTTRGGFQIVFEYMDQMKKLGIYDNSTIIILGDHGRAPDEIEGKQHLDHLTSPIVTALLVKPANAESAPLKIDSKSELSNDFFPASVIEYAGIDHKDFGTSYKDVVDGDLHPDRYMQTFDWHGYGKVVYKAYYKITGDARNFDNWEELDGHE